MLGVLMGDVQADSAEAFRVQEGKIMDINNEVPAWCSLEAGCLTELGRLMWGRVQGICTAACITW